MSELLSEINTKLSHYLPQKAISAFAGIGLLFAAKKSFDTLSDTVSTLWNTIPGTTKDLSERYGPGSWVLITGATDGIGKQYALAFAKRGFNIIIVGRNATKVVSFCDEIKDWYKVDVRPIIANFARSAEPNFFEKIYKQLEGLDISVIINNVGVSEMELFHLMNWKKMVEMNIVNLLPTVMIARHYINHMLSREKRSCIINLSSVAANLPNPKHGMYSPTKAFADCFAENMFIEYKDKIDVLSVRPQFVETKLYKGIGGTKNFCSVKPERVAEDSLQWLGKSRYFTYGARWHELIGSLYENNGLFNYCVSALNPH